MTAACACASPAASLWWPALFVAVTFAGAALAALVPSPRRVMTGAELAEIRVLRRALAVEALQRRRVVATAREWMPARELAQILIDAGGDAL